VAWKEREGGCGCGTDRAVVRAVNAMFVRSAGTHVATSPSYANGNGNGNGNEITKVPGRIRSNVPASDPVAVGEFSLRG
jgi:hypothetical protein